MTEIGTTEQAARDATRSAKTRRVWAEWHRAQAERQVFDLDHEYFGEQDEAGAA